MSERDQDFEDAGRGLIAALDPGRIEAPDGRVVWDSNASRSSRPRSRFARGPHPPTTPGR